MIKSFYRFILIALALPLVLVSCHDEVEAVDDGMPFQMILRIPAAEGEAGGTRGMTRADGTDWTPDNPNKDYNTEGEGEGLDYYITGKDLILLFCQNNIVIDYAEPRETHFVMAQGGFYEFFVKGRLNKIKSGETNPYDIVVLANTKGMLHFNPINFNEIVGSHEDAIYPNLVFNYVAQAGIDDIAHTFTENNFLSVTNQSYINNRDKETAARIPMWGRVEGKPLNEGTPVIVPIMRSLAKIRIALADDVRVYRDNDDITPNFSYSIDKIEMVGTSTKGTLMPKDAHHKVTDDSPVSQGSQRLTDWWPDSRNQMDTQNVPDGTENNHLHLQFYNKPETKFFYTYAPETRNGSGQFYFNVFLTCKNKTTNEVVSQEEYRMEFGDYIKDTANGLTGRWLPVMRNHYYMYKITRIDQGHAIHLEPWVLWPRDPIMM